MHRPRLGPILSTFTALAFMSIFFFLNPIIKTSAAPPAGFQKNLVIGQGLNYPTGFAFAPDGRIFIIEKDGAVRVFKDGQLLAAPALTLEVENVGDLGLLGIALDPDFENNGYIYLHYTTPDRYTHIGRFTMQGYVATEGPTILYTTNGVTDITHTGGGIAFGPDGKLYFSFGDGLYGPNSQNPASSFGKVMRLNKDGTIPVDNPFYGYQGTLNEIYAMGFRNPFTIAFDKVSGQMFLADVGETTWEEINLIKPGLNYGWPNAEGDCGACPFQNPLYTYNHDGQTASVILGQVYRGSQFPVEYHSDIFFGDYSRHFIKNLDLQFDGEEVYAQPENVHDFDPEAGTVVDLKTDPAGDIYFLTIYPGQLYKVSSQGANSQPIVNISADVTEGERPLEVNFSSEGTYDPDGDSMTFNWDFGDGTNSTEPDPTKVYQRNGRYTVTLSVSDSTANSISQPLVIQVGTPPVITIVQPSMIDTYTAGDIIDYSATAIDSNGVPISQANITTEVLLHHLTHIHQFIGPLEGVSSGSFEIPVNGETHPDQSYEIVFTAEDPQGLISSKSVSILPNTAILNINTQPDGMQVAVRSQPKIAPYGQELLAGSQIEISTLPVQQHQNTLYQFESWSDQGSLSHQIILPESGINLTANFTETVPFTAEYFNNMDLSGDPVLIRNENTINYTWGPIPPHPAVNPDNFSVRWSKNTYFSGGLYQITTVSDDGIRMFVDGSLVFNHWYDQSFTEHTGEFEVPEGFHDLVVEYYENTFDAHAEFYYEKIFDSNSYYAEYFDNMDLAGEPVHTSRDSQIDFDWGLGTPAPNVPNDNYSARWTRTISFSEGNYLFETTSDDGVRLYLDDQLIIDNWTDHGTTVDTTIKFIPAGEHEIRLEYYENGWDSVISFNYEPTDQPPPEPDAYTASFYSNIDLSGEPAITRSDDTIDYNWGLGSPDPAVNTDNFSASWIKTESFTQGSYTFETLSDDGVRLFVDGLPIIDNWTDHGATLNSAEVELTEGDHQIELHYYERGWDAVIRLNYFPTVTANNYDAEFFNNMELSGDPVLTRSDPKIDFDWGMSSPDDLINTDGFSARWSAVQDFTEGSYYFETISDDGVRVYLDDQLIIDSWTDHGAKVDSVTIFVVGGQHTITVEYYENGWDAVIKFNYYLQ